jgi:hypothetical protein
LKRLSALLLLSVALILGTGVACHKTTTAPIPNAINAFDGDTYRGLMDAQAAINSFKADVQAGKVTLSPAGKTALNQAIQDYDAANTLWQAYHASAGTESQAPLQSAMTKLTTDVSTLGGLR